MNEQRSIFLPIVLTTLISAIVFGGIGYYLAEGKRSSEHSSQITTQASPTAAASIKTYVNTKYGYTIQYPNDWKIDSSRTSDNEVVFDTGVTESHEAIKVEASTKTLDQWVKGFDKSVTLKTSDLTIDGQPAIRVDTSEFGATYVGVKKGADLYVFTTDGKMIDNGMLASFKFANADLKTYTNTKYGFSFKYPQNYTVEEETLGDEKSLRITNYPSSTNVTKGDIPNDMIAARITYANITPSVKERENQLLKNVPGIKKQTLTTSDGTTVTYYVYYSSQASNYSTLDSKDRLAQIFAYFTLNGKDFITRIDNYEWTPLAMEQKQIDFIIQLLKTVKSPAS